MAVTKSFSETGKGRVWLVVSVRVAVRGGGRAKQENSTISPAGGKQAGGALLRPADPSTPPPPSAENSPGRRDLEARSHYSFC